MSDARFMLLGNSKQTPTKRPRDATTAAAGGGASTTKKKKLTGAKKELETLLADLEYHGMDAATRDEMNRLCIASSNSGGGVAAVRDGGGDGGHHLPSGGWLLRTNITLTGVPFECSRWVRPAAPSEGVVPYPHQLLLRQTNGSFELSRSEAADIILEKRLEATAEDLVMLCDAVRRFGPRWVVIIDRHKSAGSFFC
eukprot:PhM_4_TR11370/c0_g1_i1/m.28986